jgi:hypothetical protein
VKWSNVIWVLVLAGAALATLRVGWPSEERRIQKLLANLAQEASAPAQGRALSDVAAANRIADYFAPEFELNVNAPGAPDVSISHRSELVQAVLAARSRHPGVKIDLLDPQTVELTPPSAVVDATVRAQAPGEREPFVAEMRLTLVKIEARWRVRKVENVRTFE